LTGFSFLLDTSILPTGTPTAGFFEKRGGFPVLIPGPRALRRAMKTLSKSFLCLLLYAVQASAQMPMPAGIAPVPDASIGFSNMTRGGSPSGRTGFDGVTAGITEDFPGRHGVVLEVGYLRAPNVFGTGHRNDVLTYMTGPVFYPSRRREIVTNVHVLGGGARVRGVVPLSTGGFALAHVHNIAWALGAGIEHWFSDSMARRIGADAVHTSFFNSSQVIRGQYDLRTTASLVYYFERRRRTRR
jgi:hypothetical protein